MTSLLAVLQHRLRFFVRGPLFMSNISPFTVVALNSRIVRGGRPLSLSLPLSLSHSPCESDEIQHVKKTSHVDDGAEPEFCVTVALASSWMDG